MKERSILQDAIDAAVLGFHYAQKAALCHQAHIQVLRSKFQHFVKAHIYTANKSTESFAIIDEEKNNTTSGRIVEKKANIIYSENATDEKKNISIDLREAHEFAQVRSGKDSKPARKNCGNHCIVLERQTLWRLIFIMIIMLLNMPSASASDNQSVVLIKNYTVFQNDIPAMFYCNGSGYENGALIGWLLNGTGYSSKHVLRGITYVIDPPVGAYVSSRLFIPSNSSINNNTEVMCKTIDSTSNIVHMTVPANLTIQGPLDAPSNFSVNVSTISNTTFLLSWGAPFSLDVTEVSPDIFYYTLCTNITIYGCRTIPSDPDCTFPRTCTSSVDFTHPSLNGTNGGQNKTIMDYGDPIQFTFFAVNGAGKGNVVSKPFRFTKESGENIAPSQTEPKSVSILPTATILTGNVESEVPSVVLEVAVAVAVPVSVCGLILLICLVIAIKYCCLKQKPSELPVHVELYSYATHQEKSTLAANQQKVQYREVKPQDETSKLNPEGYIDVECHPVISVPAPHQYREVKPQDEIPKPDPNGCIVAAFHPNISIPAPHHEVQYIEVKPHNEKPKLNPRGYNDVECHQVIVIPAPHHEVQYSEPHNEKP